MTMQKTDVVLPMLAASAMFSYALAADATRVVDDKTFDDVAALVSGNTDFALNVYRELPQNENLVFSPFGASEALAICYAGAHGDTALQMEKTLGFPTQGEELHVQFAVLHLVQENLKQSEHVQYEMANSFWSKIQLQQSYLDFAKDNYGVDLFAIDNPGDAFKAINVWVSEKTDGKGSSPVKLDMLADPDMELVILNTVHMDAPWGIPFDARSTKDRAFTLLDGTEIQVPTMYLNTAFKYGRSGDLSVLEIPYKGKELSMYIVLPDKQQAPGDADGAEGSKDVRTLAQIEAELTGADLRKAIQLTQAKLVHLYLPKISIESELDFGYQLRAMGMPDAFSDENADFRGMTGDRRLKIDDVLQNARIDIDEKGTEAAAVTAITMATRSGASKRPPRQDWIEFRVDRPFMYVVQENLTGTILFMGRVVDPQAGTTDT